MDAAITARTATSFTLQVEVRYNDSMLGFEEALQRGLNEAGVLATAEGLKRFDTDGSPITVGPVKFTSKGQVEKDYQTPYGVATVARHVYQSPGGGPTYCPLDRDARIVVSSTPRFAKVLSHKYAEFSSPRVQGSWPTSDGRRAASTTPRATRRDRPGPPPSPAFDTASRRPPSWPAGYGPPSRSCSCTS